MAEEKTYVFDGGGNQSSIDPNLWAALGNGGGFGGNGFNNPFWALILLAFLRNGFGWSGDNSASGFVSSQLGQAIAGNANALQNIATQLNCNIGQVQAGIAGIQNAIQCVGAQNNLSFAQTVNAIQAGNTAIANQISQCCCDNKLLATTQGYENRIANTEQTAILGSKIDNQTTLINDKFCQLEMREMQNKLDSERAKTLALTNQLSQEHQNAYIASIVAPLQQKVADIECKLPDVAKVPYSPVVGIPSCVAYNYGLQGLGLGYGFNPNGSIWS